jgi:hypothetical protein
VQFLVGKFPGEETRLPAAVALAQGSIPLAIGLLEEKEDDYHRWYMDWQRACFRQDSTQVLQLSESFQEMGKELQTETLDLILFLLPVIPTTSPEQGQ